MSNVYGHAEEGESIATIHRAIELGIDFIDTADMYGFGHNEELIARAIGDRRERVFLATKFGNVRDSHGNFTIRGDAQYVRDACEASLRRLGIDHIDLYYQHRVDPQVPIEETVGAMAGLVKEGKVRFLGLSEAAAATIRRAHALHPIAALQSEYSLWSRDVEAEILPAVREIGIGFVPYSPLGRGFLAGAVKRDADMSAEDGRRRHPRFAAENIEKNLAIIAPIERLAQAKGCTSAHIALAWVLAKGEDLVPIPGTKRRIYLEQNAAAVEIEFTGEEIASLEAEIPHETSGTRYPAAMMAALNR